MEPARNETADEPVIIDLGKKSRKQVRRLKKGRGSLAERIDEAVGALKAQGQIAANAQTVVVVVKEKRKRKKLSPFGF